jgi:hypothetical protein
MIATLACSRSAPTADSSTDAAPSPADAGAPSHDQGNADDGPVGFPSWPSDGTVTIASGKDAVGPNLSGLVYEPASGASQAVLWGIQNQPSKIHRLAWNGSAFVATTSNVWVTGKLLRYPSGTGSPDAEGLTRTDWTTSEMYVAAERDNDVPGVSRQSILRFDLSGTTGILDATHEWVLTGDLPAASANHGLEGIAWIPDAYLVERGFFDESTQAAYAPAAYPDHGSGVFLVSRDDTGVIYGYVLDHQAGRARRVATVDSEQPSSVDLTFDRDTGTLWSLCDKACGGRMALLDIDSTGGGRFVVRALVPPPKALAGMKNEGIALAPDSDCSGNRRPFFWADDEESGGYAIRKGSISCGRLH